MSEREQFADILAVMAESVGDDELNLEVYERAALLAGAQALRERSAREEPAEDESPAPPLAAELDQVRRDNARLRHELKFTSAREELVTVKLMIGEQIRDYIRANPDSAHGGAGYPPFELAKLERRIDARLAALPSPPQVGQK